MSISQVEACKCRKEYCCSGTMVANNIQLGTRMAKRMSNAVSMSTEQSEGSLKGGWTVVREAQRRWLFCRGLVSWRVIFVRLDLLHWHSQLGLNLKPLVHQYTTNLDTRNQYPQSECISLCAIRKLRVRSWRSGSGRFIQFLPFRKFSLSWTIRLNRGKGKVKGKLVHVLI
jgi:hypothetical protein